MHPLDNIAQRLDHHQYPVVRLASAYQHRPMATESNPAPAMETHPLITELVQALVEYGEGNPAAVRHYAAGERFITQGAPSDLCYLVKAGTITILEASADPSREKEIAPRGPMSIIGESAVLERNAIRRSSAVVTSVEGATLVALDRDAFRDLIATNPNLRDKANQLLRQLQVSRAAESEDVLSGAVHVSFEMMTAALGDIHNFSGLSEVVWDVAINSFLFDFIEVADEAARDYGGIFEDQGDGFRVLFRGIGHAARALRFSTVAADRFRALRNALTSQYSTFDTIGLGIGLCSDVMTIRQRLASPDHRRRVLSHALNVAAAMSKHRRAAREIDIYVDLRTASLVDQHSTTLFCPPEELALNKLSVPATVRRVQSPSAFVSYSSVDKDFVATLVRDLQRDGVEIWQDVSKIRAGEKVNQALSLAIQRHSLFLAILSPHALQSKWVARELEQVLQAAVSQHKVILPVVLGSVALENLPPQIEQVRLLRFDADPVSAYAELLASIREHRMSLIGSAAIGGRAG